jgi:hypothetical protein
MKSQKFTRTAIEESIARATALERSLGTIEKKDEPIPAGYRPREEWQEIWGFNQSTTSLRIRDHLKAGRMKQIKLRVVDVTGRRQHKPFFKAIK